LFQNLHYLFLNSTQMLEYGYCKLCNQFKPLLNESHIIPKFIYKQGGFDISKKIKLLSYDINSKIKDESGVSPIFDSKILCQECDNIKLGKDLEDYSAKVIFNKNLSPRLAPINIQNFVSDGNTRGNIFENINYTKFKLFILSILWRASISKNIFFDNVDLGKHEELIRNMIYNCDAKTVDIYPIFIQYWWYSNITTDIIIKPTRIRYKNGFRYRLVMSGFIFDIFISSNIVTDEMLEYAICPEGKITLIQVNEFHLRNEVTLFKFLSGTD